VEVSHHLYLWLLVVIMGCVNCKQPGTSHPDVKNTVDQSAILSSDVRAVVINLEKLLDKGLYFKFESCYTSSRNLLPEKYKTYFDIFYCDIFGYPGVLEVHDQLLLRKYYSDLTEPEKINYHLIKISHYQKKYAYRNALAEVLKLEQFAERLDTFKKDDLQQYHATFSALQHVPPMSVMKVVNDSVQLIKQWVHLQIPVSINGHLVNLIFDTGAGKSLLTKSLAEKFGLKMFETATDIAGATGARAATNLGIAENVLIGKTNCKNVVFEVIEDSLLGVPEYNFFFDGLVGLNLLYPLGSLALNENGTLKILGNADAPIRNNLAMYHFSNRVAISFQNDTIPVKFDTGAYMSIFNRHFYELYSSILLERGKPEPIEYGGIGGGRSTFNMVHLDSMAFAVYNDSVVLRDTRIHSKYIQADTVTYFGLLGLDFVDHFDQITMNFNPNSIEYTTRY
jgi:predicted aspartyl protease